MVSKYNGRSMDLIAQDDTTAVDMTLPWPAMCRLACTAMIRKLDLDDLVIQALQRRIMSNQRRLNELRDQQKGGKQRRV